MHVTLWHPTSFAVPPWKAIPAATEITVWQINTRSSILTWVWVTLVAIWNVGNAWSIVIFQFNYWKSEDVAWFYQTENGGSVRTDNYCYLSFSSIKVVYIELQTDWSRKWQTEAENDKLRQKMANWGRKWQAEAKNHNLKLKPPKCNLKLDQIVSLNEQRSCEWD